MSDTTSTTNPSATETPAPAAPTKSKQELRNEQLAAKRAEKLAAKEAAKAVNAEKRANGIIGTLKAALDTANGTTKQEIINALTTKFPGRDPLGMATTVGIQLSRLQKSTGRKIVSAKVDGRGRVYGFDGVVVFPQAVLSGPPAQVSDSTPESRGAVAPETTPEPVTTKTKAQGKGKKGKGK